MRNTDIVTDNRVHTYPLGESTRSAVSWGAVLAGAVIAAALTVTLIVGGSGLGFLSVSPWQNDGASGTTIAVGTIVWLLLTQIIAYGIAGYVTGRLRTKWTDVLGDEVFFRDTAHGFIVWAVSSIVGVVLIASAAGAIISGATSAGATVVAASAEAAGTAAAPAMANNNGQFSLDYYTDSLLRPMNPGQDVSQRDSRKEVATILTRSVVQGEMSAEDKDYLISLVAKRTGVTEYEAKARLEEVTARAKKAADELEVQAREAADTARTAAAIFSLWAFASLLLGAFVASFAATIGGRARDL